MPKFGHNSRQVYKTLHPKLQLLVDLVVEYVDISLVEGLRSQETQNNYYNTGASELMWPDSKHNKTEDPALKAVAFDISDAVDIVPFPTKYTSKEQMLVVAGYVLAFAKLLRIDIRWGGDWNRDGILNNQREDFFDCWHFEVLH
jgi:peptidoglycan L-alanyl-D-glutamate endopeptidase CwlK